MAKSFMDQLFDLVGLKVPDVHGHYSPSAYRDEQSTRELHRESSDAEKNQPAAAKLTGVARYLAANYPEEQTDVAQADAAGTAKLTGVAKYLAKLQQEEQEKAEAEAAALAKMTGVARYLAKLEGQIAVAPSETETVAEPANTANLTRVEKYLAKQQAAPSEIPQPEPEAKAAPQAAEVKAPEQKPVVEEQKAQPKQEAEQKPAPAPAAKKTDEIIDLTENASQCQSTTSKGTQCRRKTNLETLEKTIDNQKYRFLACGQHHSEEFVPFAELLQEG
jgi:hypothetical protein